MPRPRKLENRGLPEGLYHKGVKGYVFKRVDNTWKSLGHDKARAVVLAKRYNATFRVDSELTHVITEFCPKKSSLNGSPLSEFFDRLRIRYEEDEQPSKETLTLFLNRLGKLEEILGERVGDSVTLSDVNHVLTSFATDKSNEVYNRWLGFMVKVFDYALDEGVMTDNPARRKKSRRIEAKRRNRLSLTEYKEIWLAAPLWLRTAMALSIETTHSVNEVCSMKYTDFEQLNQPILEQGLKIYGYLKVHRQKVKDKEASRVRIPVTASLLQIIRTSREDGIASPYIVHRIPLKRSNEVSQNCDHYTQVNKKYLSKQFSNVRDRVGVQNHLTSDRRPTFHEIRALSIHLYDKAGYDPQARAAHTDSRSTEVYKEGHIHWVTVPAAELSVV
ncbi:integrase [Vibrio sp. SCSIO 43169]|uniref:integrase n=1 Tax=Vibrio sp. SCSIO 43169 TaxID=2822801 RepID=UPI0020436B26|nr:integrase [Vibrio sp. SCSIO 43169]MCM5507166.1 integrase [Vibrio sp. SCSIO 43169]